METGGVNELEDGEQKFTAAIERCTEALKRSGHTVEEEAKLVSDRSEAFSGLSNEIRTRPAETSERHALFGLDPIQLAELAVRDAEKACRLNPGSAEAEGRRGYALYLLENFGESRQAYLSALALDPTNASLQAGLKTVDEMYPSERVRRDYNVTDNELECMLCFRLFYEPVTTSCGHTFCKNCLLRSMDYANRCPSCRTILFVTPGKISVNVALQSLLERHCGEEYQKRKLESVGERHQHMEGRALIPLFVMDVVMPGQRMALNIFEPRYRLLIRRVMGSGRTFGMIGLNEERSDVLDIGCEVEIVECSCLPDGRFEIEVIGTRRFKVMTCSEQDGYRLANAQYLQDDPVPTESTEEINHLAEEVCAKIDALLNSIRNHRGHSSALLNALVRCVGPKPVKDNGQSGARWCEDISFYAGVILSSLQCIDKSDVMRMTSTKDRLERLLEAQVSCLARR